MRTRPFPWQPNAATDREMVACVNFSPTIYGYLSGFVQGADAMYSTLQADRSGQDLLVYPLVYCLRHALELGLKQIIMGARILLEEEEQGFPHDHDLWRLWCAASPVLKRIWPDDGTEPGYDMTERTILAFSRVDPTGEGFRYPIRKNWDPTLDPDLRHLDIDQLYRDARTTLDMLIGADTGIDAHIDNMEEIKEEARAYYQSEAAEAEYERYYEAEYERNYEEGF